MRGGAGSTRSPHSHRAGRPRGEAVAVRSPALPQHTQERLLSSEQVGALGSAAPEESIDGAASALLREKKRKKIKKTLEKAFQIFEECSRRRNSFLVGECPPGTDLRSTSIRERQKDYSSRLGDVSLGVNCAVRGCS